MKTDQALFSFFFLLELLLEINLSYVIICHLSTKPWTRDRKVVKLSLLLHKGVVFVKDIFALIQIPGTLCNCLASLKTF